jgi:23S rRNA (pseudouridine1915-N3)-methyltransferase
VKLTVVAVGRLKSGPERDLARRYRERAEALGRASGFSPVEVVEIAESRARRDADRRAEEARAILDRAGPAASALLVAFDERGRSISSESLAERLRTWRDGGTPALALVVGGADGLDPLVRDRAELVLSFGAMTLPHQLVRVLVLEQLYRCLTILAGHPYHRGG